MPQDDRGGCLCIHSEQHGVGRHRPKAWLSQFW